MPTGIVVSCQNEKSQLQNREQAMRILRARLLAAAQEEADAAASDARRSQVRTVDRSERIRTYNYPENRISDHRTGYKAYNLDQVLDGDLEPVIESSVEADLAARLDSSGRMTPTRRLLADAAARLREAGVDSPEHDAAELLAHVLGTDRSRLVLVDGVADDLLACLRRAGGASCCSRAAPAPDRHRVVPPRRASGRAGRVRAPSGDRAPGRLGDRAGRTTRGAGGRRPLHRLRCDRQGGRATRSRTRGSTRSS